MGQNDFKRFDRVMIKHSGAEGYIDTILGDKYLIKCLNEYKWVDIWDLEKIGHIKVVEVSKERKDNKILNRMLGKNL